MDGFLGEIRIFAFPFVPKLWAACSGTLLPIAQNQALFALLGTTYGGNGTTTFALPDLRSRVPVGMTTSGNTYPIGTQGGVESVAITTQTMAAHFHALTAQGNVAGTVGSAANATPATAGVGTSGVTINIYAAPATMVALAADTMPSSGGGNQPHSNLQPYLTLLPCICTQGIFPSRS